MRKIGVRFCFFHFSSTHSFLLFFILCPFLSLLSLFISFFFTRLFFVFTFVNFSSFCLSLFFILLHSLFIVFVRIFILSFFHSFILSIPFYIFSSSLNPSVSLTPFFFLMPPPSSCSFHFSLSNLIQPKFLTPHLFNSFFFLRFLSSVLEYLFLLSETWILIPRTLRIFRDYGNSSGISLMDCYDDMKHKVSPYILIWPRKIILFTIWWQIIL